MRALPKTWHVTTSGEICEYITSGSRDWKSYYSDQGPLFIRTQDINQDRLDLSETAHVDLPKKVEGKRSRVQAGDLLVTITGANVGKVALVPDGIPEAYVSQSVGLMRFKDKRNGPYLHYYLQSDQAGRKRVLDLVYGIGRPVLSLQNLRDIPISLPPLPEQRRIVAEIEKQFTRVEAGSAALRRVLAALKRYRAAVLKAACEGSLVPTEAELAKTDNQTATFETGEALLTRILTERRLRWHGRGKYKDPAIARTSNSIQIPEGWTWATIEQISSRVQYGSSAKTDEGPTGVPVLRMGNIQEGKLDFDRLKFLPNNHGEFPELLLVMGDLLFNRTNSAELVGKTAVYKGSPNPCSFASYLIRVQFMEGCLPSFAGFFINSVFGRAWISDVVNQQVGQANVNGTKLQALAIPLPPLTEQSRVVAEVERRLSVVEELEAVVTADLKRAALLRQSILQKAFSGELTCDSKSQSSEVVQT